MKQLVLAIMLLGALLAPVALRAHDASKHKGKGTTGEIVTVADDRFELKTASGNVMVTLSGDTRIEHGKSTVDKTHLLKGSKVTVFGTKLPGGELVAREVVVSGNPAKGGMAKHGMKGDTHKH